MERKFKLIKKFPASPELDTIVSRQKNGHYIYANDINSASLFWDREIENYPEFWEEVKEKEYTILSFRDKEYKKILKADSQLKDVFCYNDGKAPFFSLNELLKSNSYQIFSVKRNSDNEVFTIGDNLDFCEGRQITDIEINSSFVGGVRIGVNGGCQGIESCNKLDYQKILTTEDEEDIFEGDSVYIVSEDFSLSARYVIKINTTIPSGKYFSGIQSAKEYIKWNKPMYSLNDILESYTDTDGLIGRLEKLNKK